MNLPPRFSFDPRMSPLDAASHSGPPRPPLERGPPIVVDAVRVNNSAGRTLDHPMRSSLPPAGPADSFPRAPTAPWSSPREALARSVDGDPWVFPIAPRLDVARMKAPSSAGSLRSHPQTPQHLSRQAVKHPNPNTKTDRRRAQCRANQARYRERQRQKKADVEEETACLRELVGLLEIQRTLMRATQNPDFEYVHHAVTSFFRHFRRGVAGANDDDVAMSELLVGDRASSARAPTWTKVGRAGRNVSLLRQIAFVRCVVSEDAEFGGDSDGGARGPDALLEQCWRYSALHSNPWVQLLTIHRSSSLSRGVEHVVATAQLTVGITEQTLSVVFPGVRPRLGKKLLGKKVEYSVQFDLEFARAGVGELLQLVWATTRIDVVGSLLKVLGDPSEVEEVVRCARVSMHGYIGGR